jgi:bile acid:Na+ symporter, BASS family
VEQSPLVEIGLPLALFVIMVGIGLTLTLADFRREARAPRAMVLGSVAQLVLMPLLAFGIAAALQLSAPLTLGLVVLAAAPGGTTSNLVALLARANVALSIVLTVVASVVTIVTLPLAANLALLWRADDADVVVRVPLVDSIGLLLGIVLVPVVVGMVVRARRPEAAVRLEPKVSAFGAVVLVLLIAGIAFDLRDELPTLIAQAGPAALLLNLGGLGLGFALGLLGVSRRDRRTCAAELGIKNGTLAILIAVTVVGNEVVATPAAVYSVVMYLTAVGLVVYGRNRSLMEVDETTGAAEA